MFHELLHSLATGNSRCSNAKLANDLIAIVYASGGARPRVNKSDVVRMNNLQASLGICVRNHFQPVAGREIQRLSPWFQNNWVVLCLSIVVNAFGRLEHDALTLTASYTIHQ
mgnify:CR=1 FL=1